MPSTATGRPGRPCASWFAADNSGFVGDVDALVLYRRLSHNPLPPWGDSD